MFVTTSPDPTADQQALAVRLSEELHIPFFERGGYTVSKLCRLHASPMALIVEKEDIRIVQQEMDPFYYHPSMGMVRAKRFLDGGHDHLLQLAGIRPGDRIFDGTCGMAADALMFSLAAGPEGQVDACESNPYVAAVVREGLKRYSNGPDEILQAMRRIRVITGDHLEYLKKCPDRSYDVVYFDPMFDRPVHKSSGISPLRGLADHRPLAEEVIVEAVRVASRAVVFKDHWQSPWFDRFGFRKFARKTSDVAYGVLETAPAKIPLVVIIGPTAVGKTALSIEVAKRFDGEIISGDSMQVYQGMDIGTAKIKPEEQEGIPHHLLDIIRPDEPFSAAHFQEHAKAAIQDIHARGKLPVIAGGTGLYVESLIYDFPFSTSHGESEERARLRERAQKEGLDLLHRELQEQDPEAAAKIHPHDEQRILRALEMLASGEKPSAKAAMTRKESPYHVLLIGLTMDRAVLYDRINRRVQQMIEQGWEHEVRSLLDQGFSRQLPSMRGLGYKEHVLYFRGYMSRQELIRLISRNTRRFAKRQLSWFRHMEGIRWFELKDGSSNVEQFDSVYATIQAHIGFGTGDI